jgi:AcrR family transcriptional regulator
MHEPRLLIEALYKYGGDREDRLTEVLASVLEVNHDLCRDLTARLGLGCQPTSFRVETQFGPPGQRRLVDLVLRGVDHDGKVLATVFIENKYNPMARLETCWFSEDQAMRQRRALQDESGEQLLGAIASKSDLDLLDGPPGARPRFDPRGAYDEVISWEDVRELTLQVSAQPSPQRRADRAEHQRPTAWRWSYLPI